MDLEPLQPHQPLRLPGLQTVDLSTIGVSTTWDEAARVLGQAARACWRREANELIRSCATRKPLKTTNHWPSRRRLLSRIPVKVEQAEVLKKPEWIRVKAGSPTTRFYEIKQILRREQPAHRVRGRRARISANALQGTATFHDHGDKCTRAARSATGHGRPDLLDVNEPENMAHHCQTPAQVRGHHQR